MLDGEAESSQQAARRLQLGSASPQHQQSWDSAGKGGSKGKGVASSAHDDSDDEDDEDNCAICLSPISNRVRNFSSATSRYWC